MPIWLIIRGPCNSSKLKGPRPLPRALLTVSFPFYVCIV